MNLIFIRHGQTDFNKQKRLQGQEVDATLNATGIEQVKKVVPSLTQTIDFIISSPLKRAHQTAEVIGEKLGQRIELRNEMKECSFGTLGGKTWLEVEAETGDTTMREKHKNLTFDYRPFGGESVQDVKQRVAGFIEELKNKYPDKTILIASHGCILDVMHLLYPQKEKPDGGNATIHEFEF